MMTKIVNPLDLNSLAMDVHKQIEAKIHADVEAELKRLSPPINWNHYRQYTIPGKSLFPPIIGFDGSDRGVMYRRGFAFRDNFHLHPWDAPAGMEMDARLGYSRYIMSKLWFFIKGFIK